MGWLDVCLSSIQPVTTYLIVLMLTLNPKGETNLDASGKDIDGPTPTTFYRRQADMAAFVSRTIGFASVWAIIGAALQCSAMNPEWMYCGTGLLLHVLEQLKLTEPSACFQWHRHRYSQRNHPSLGNRNGLPYISWCLW